MTERILITGGTKDAFNSNVNIRRFMADGFKKSSIRPSVLNVCSSLFSAAVNSFNPSLVVVAGSLAHTSSDASIINSKCKRLGIPLVYWLHDDPYEFDMNWLIDSSYERVFIFTNEKNCLPYYDRERVFFMPLAASDTIQSTINLDKSIGNGRLFFCGYPYSERVSIISQIAQFESIRKILSVYGPNWRIPNVATVDKSLSTIMLHLLYAHSLFTLNIGRNLNIANSRYFIPASSPGPRTFEAALMGATQIYIGQSECIDKYYSRDDGLFRVNRLEQIEEIIHCALQDPVQHAKLKRNARKATLDSHLYRHRADEILEIIK